jgi:ankyrin repeat protein
MDKLDFNITIDCCHGNSVVIRHRDVCYIGYFKGSKEEAIRVITKKYTGEVRDTYIAKLKELYSKDITENNVDVTTDDNYAVKWASLYGYLDVVEYLVSKGADVSADDNFALKWASRFGYLDIVKYLVEHGADVTAEDNYALKWAAEYEYLEVVKYLLSQGASLES